MPGYTRVGKIFTSQMWGGLLDSLELSNIHQGGRGILSGLGISAGSGLTLSIAAGVMRGLKEVELDATTASMPPSTTVYVWIDEEGDVVTTATTADPGGTYACLGKVITGGSTISSVTTDGRLDLMRMPDLRTYLFGDNALAIDLLNRRVGMGNSAPEFRLDVRAGEIGFGAFDGVILTERLSGIPDAIDESWIAYTRGGTLEARAPADEGGAVFQLVHPTSGVAVGLHAASHSAGGTDEVEVEDLATASTDRRHYVRSANGALVMDAVDGMIEVLSNTNLSLATHHQKCISNRGHVGSPLEYTLPELDAAHEGMVVWGYVASGSGMRFIAQSGDFFQVAGQASVADGYLQSTTVGALVRLQAVRTAASTWAWAAQVQGGWTINYSGSLTRHIRTMPHEADYGGPVPVTHRFIGSRTAGPAYATNDDWLMLFIPERDLSIRYVKLFKASGTGSQRAQAAIFGPVLPPIRGTRRITLSTDSPVLLAKTADITAPAAQGTALLDLGARYNLYAGFAYWVAVQFGTTFDAEGAGTRRASSNASIQPVGAFRTCGASSAPTYASNFGTIGTTTLAEHGADYEWYFTYPIVDLE